MQNSTKLIVGVAVIGVLALILFVFRNSITALTSTQKSAQSASATQSGSSNTASGQSIVYAPTYDYNQENMASYQYTTQVSNKVQVNPSIIGFGGNTQ